MLQKIIDNDEHWERAKEEVTQVVTQHSVTQTKLEEQEQLTFMEEQRARVSENICTYSTYSIQHQTHNARKPLDITASLSMLYRKRSKT